MKILISAYSCEPNRGSELGNGWNWSLALARLGHNVWTLTRPAGRAAIERQRAASPEPRLHVTYVDTPRWSAPLLKGQPGVYARYLLWQRAAYRAAQHLHAAHGFDVVHHVTWGSLRGGSPLWRLGAPFVFGPVGGGQVTPAAFRSYFGRAQRGEAVRAFYTRHVLPRLPPARRMLRRTALFLASNEETLALAQRMGAPRAQLFLDTGLPSSFFADPVSPRGPAGGPLRVLWVGRLYPRKGLPLSLEALARMNAPARLTVLGHGPLAEQLPAWIRAHGLDGRVDVRGWVPWDEVRQAYHTHDVFLFTSLRDAFGSQLLEAMACGLPVVTLDHQGARAFVPDAAGIKVPVTAPADTVRRVARALDALHAGPDARGAMGRAGRAFAQTQQWPRRAAAATALYASLFGEQPRAASQMPSLDSSIPFYSVTH